ncbi:MAG: AsmA-like C-terminal region-containing protein [Dinoroseobacter sp.]|nr:AsmA-like C-terminal region-containing protein [Dinoroseobacter sp.]
MTETEQSQSDMAEVRPVRAAEDVPSYSARRRSGLLVVIAAALVLATLGGLSALILRGSVSVPDPVVGLLEDRLRGIASGGGIARIGEIEIGLSDTGRPTIIARDTVLRAPRGTARLVVPRFEVTLSRRALVRAELRPLEIRVDGAALRVTRRSDGFLRLALQSGETLTEAPSLPALIARLEDYFERAPLDQLERLTLTNLSLQVSDGRLARSVTLSDGVAQVSVDPRKIALSLALDLEGAPAGAGAALRFETTRNTPDTRMTLRLSDLPAELLSRQSPAFAALSAYDGTVSARLDGALAPDGALAALEGDVELGAGKISVPWQEARVDVEKAALELGYDPALNRFHLTAFELSTDLGAGRLSGNVDVLPLDAGEIWPDIQFALFGEIDRLKLTPKLRSDAEDMTLRLDGRFAANARQLDLGLVQLADLQTGIRATGGGRVEWPADDKPRLALDLHIPEASAPRVAQFWPARGKGAKLGRWLTENVSDGVLQDAFVALRMTPGERPVLGVSFSYADAVVRVLPEFPVLNSARGHATLFDNKFLIRVAEGSFATEQAGAVSLAGSSFEVMDTRIKGGDARLRLEIDGKAEALLDVLARPPVRLKDRFTLPPQGISGAADGQADFEITLRRGAPFNLNRLRVEAQIRDAQIAEIAPELDLRDGQINVAIMGPELSLSGSGLIERLPVTFALGARLDASQNSGEPTLISGTAELSEDGLGSVGVSIPPGVLGGDSTRAIYDLTLFGPDRPPELKVASELRGMSIQVAELGWTKPAAQAGRAELDVVLGNPPQLDRLELDFEGFSAAGRVQFDVDDNSLAWAQMDRLVLGQWLDVQAELVGRGAEVAPTFALTGGRLDLRKLPPRVSGATSGEGGAFAVELDEVVVGDTLALRDVRGTVLMGAVVSGTLSGQLNGRAPVRVELGPGPNARQAVRVTSNDGGAVLAAAGILSNLQGGPMDLLLEATGASGSYTGQLKLASTRLIESPAAVELLSALSIVGLVEQLANGGGIGFTEVSTGLQITPEGVGLRDGLANGPALGLTFEGVVQPDRDQIALQGVVSPVYVINSVGGELLGTPGEGLIGVNYRIEGTRAAPTVTVNPLSVLTPGIFRDLFRRPPPQLTQ